MSAEAARAQAERLFAAGKAQLDAKHFADAAATFTQAYSLSERAWLLQYVFIAHMKAQQPLLARDALKLYLATSRYVPDRDRLVVLLDRFEAQHGPARAFPPSAPAPNLALVEARK